MSQSLYLLYYLLAMHMTKPYSHLFQEDGNSAMVWGETQVEINK